MSYRLPPSREDATYRPTVIVEFDGSGTGRITLTDEIAGIEVHRFVYAATPQREEVIRKSISILENELHLFGTPDFDCNWLSLNRAPGATEAAPPPDLLLDHYDQEELYENSLSLALGIALERSKQGEHTNDH